MLFWQALEMLGVLIAIALSIMFFAFIPIAITFALHSWSTLLSGKLLSRKESTLEESVFDESNRDRLSSDYDWTNPQDR